MGILSWIVTGSLITVLLRLIAPGRPARKRGEWLVGVAAALVAGFVATGLDFGGLDEIEPRAMALSALAATGMVALWRIYLHVSGGTGKQIEVREH